MHRTQVLQRCLLYRSRATPFQRTVFLRPASSKISPTVAKLDGHLPFRSGWTRRRVAITIGITMLAGVPVLLYANDERYRIAVSGCTRVGRALTVGVQIGLDYKFHFPLDTGNSLDVMQKKSQIHRRSAHRLLVMCRKNGGIYIKLVSQSIPVLLVAEHKCCRVNTSRHSSTFSLPNMFKCLSPCKTSVILPRCLLLLVSWKTKLDVKWTSFSWSSTLKLLE